jgi:hypothetical protein
MGVDDEVGGHALGSEGHVLGPVGDTDRPLLPVAGGELIAHLRDTGGANTDLDELHALRVGGDDDLIDEARLGALEGGGEVPAGMGGATLPKLLALRG